MFLTNERALATAHDVQERQIQDRYDDKLEIARLRLLTENLEEQLADYQRRARR